MTQLIEKQEKYGFLKWGEAALIAAIGFILMAAMQPKPEPQIVKVPVPQVIEKEVVVKVPVKLSSHDERQIQCLAENA